MALSKKGAKNVKLNIKRSPEYKETEITIKCDTIDERIQKIIDIAQDSSDTLNVRLNDTSKKIEIKDIFYFESVDEKTFVYCRDEVYSSNLNLYELEEKLVNTSFVRISKSCILNIDHLDSVKALMNGKMQAVLSNDEKVIINRHYVPIFKKKFGL